MSPSPSTYYPSPSRSPWPYTFFLPISFLFIKLSIPTSFAVTIFYLSIPLHHIPLFHLSHFHHILPHNLIPIHYMLQNHQIFLSLPSLPFFSSPPPSLYLTHILSPHLLHLYHILASFLLSPYSSFPARSRHHISTSVSIV